MSVVDRLAEEVRTRPGLDWLAEIAAGTLPHPGIAEVLGCSLVTIEAGRAVFEADPDDRYCNPLGVVAGGYANALLDLALGFAVHSTLTRGATCPTLTQSTAFHRVLKPGAGPVRCIASVVSAGRRIATAEAHLTDAAERLCASASATFLLVVPS
jgi:uncharacterized protein (TIGR00369 family)